MSTARPRRAGVALLLAAAALLGGARPARSAGGAVEELAVIVNPSAAVDRVDGARLEAIFSAVERTWADGKPIIAFSFAPEDPLRVEFERVVLRMTPDQVSRYWIDQRIRNGLRPPRQIPDPVLALRLVAKLPGSIGYVPRRLVDASVRVVARVRDGKVLPP